MIQTDTADIFLVFKEAISNNSRMILSRLCKGQGFMVSDEIIRKTTGGSMLSQIEFTIDSALQEKNRILRQWCSLR